MKVKLETREGFQGLKCISNYQPSKMVLISIFLSLAVFLGLYKSLSIDELPKKWRKLKFETRMSWNGFASSTVDLFYKAVDKTCEFK